MPRPGSSSDREEITGPAHLLYRMSIQSLVGRQQQDGYWSSDSDATPPPATGKTSKRTSVSTVTQKAITSSKPQQSRSAGPHFVIVDDDFDSVDDESSSDTGPDRTPPRIQSPANKKRKTTPKSRSKMPKSLKTSAAIAPPEGTLIVYQPTCLDHHNDAHQENRARLSALCGPEGILQRPRFCSLQWANLRELKPVRLCDMLRVHSFEYVRHLEQTCAALPAQDSKITVGTFFDDDNHSQKPLHPNDWAQTQHARRCYAVAHPSCGGFFDNDSPISHSSYMAARLAAGTVCHAIDQVVTGQTKNAFVAVRPPGHHAGPNGCVESGGFHRRPEMCTCGFCLLNNVAIGAAYAMTSYASGYDQPGAGTRFPVQIDRVAIIDFDIHHGNGTEEILRNLVPHEQRYPLPSS